MVLFYKREKGAFPEMICPSGVFQEIPGVNLFPTGLDKGKWLPVLHFLTE
jgi:hypothetical protein